MTPGDDAAALERVRAFLRDHGTPDDEIDRAETDDVLDLLVADQLLVPTRRRYTETDVAERTGMPLELLRRFWRALGFPDVAPDDAMFTDLDIEALLILQSMVELGVADIDTSLQLARVIGSSMARIAEAEVSPTSRGLLGGGAGMDDTVEAADRFAQLADVSLPAIARLLEFAWRRHVQAAIRRAMALRARSGREILPVLPVGFADMVGFTMLSQHLSDEELAAVVTRFEELAHDTVTAGGGRVVKMIGDEAMFVADSVPAAARIGLALAEAYADDELLSDVRVALAVGPVLVQDGDFYGPVVNLASRVVNMAAPGSVLVTDEFHTALEQATGSGTGTGATAAGIAEVPGEFALRPLRPRPVKDLGRLQLWVLHRPGTEPVTLDRRQGRRWERLAEVLQDLDDLRERGERLIAGVRQPPDEDADGPGGEASDRSDPPGAPGPEPLGASRSVPGEADGGDAEGSQFE